VTSVATWRDREANVTGLGLVRIAVGLMLLMNSGRARLELDDAFFADCFHWPLLPEALVPSRVVYGFILATEGTLAAIVITGWRAREALLGRAIVGAYVLACDRLQYHHNRWALLCFALLLAFTPCDRSFALVRSSAQPLGPTWAVDLAKLQVSLIYLASGGSKLLDPDWRGGLVLLERFRLYGGQAVEAGAPARLVAWLSQPDVTSALSKLAIGTELFLAIGFWTRRTRWVALVVGIGFHLVIEVTARVESFSWLMITTYGFFFLPELSALRERLRRK
jgi:Vitamin K-dependent gamma-carboxylase